MTRSDRVRTISTREVEREEGHQAVLVEKQAGGKDAVRHLRNLRQLRSQLHTLSLVVRVLFVPVLAATALVYWGRPTPLAAGDLEDAGFAVCAITLLEWAATRSTRRRIRSGKADGVEPSTGPVDAPMPIDDGERSAWAEAAWRAFSTRSSASNLQVVRVGNCGVELLFHEPIPVAQAPFRSQAGGFVWSVAASITLEELAEIGRPALGADPSASLAEIGRDEDGTYFVEEKSFTHVRLDDLEIGEDHDAWPESARSARTNTFGAPLVLVEESGELLLEPLGLSLVAPSSRYESPDGASAETLDDNALPVETRLDEESLDLPLDPDGTEVGSVADPSETAPPAIRVEPARLVPPGPVEVRILREVPDLAGEVMSDPTPSAVEFVAYLALHGYRATTSRLKEALGTERSRRSRSVSAIWRAAGEARQSLGPGFVPAASSQQAYQLAEEVSCDWMRFRALVDLARSETSDLKRRCEALIEALTLVEGVPGLSSRRFYWLDSEGVLAEIERLVVLAARELVAATDDDEIRRFALGKARILFPTDADLGRLATAR
jgi:hypothetical protein